VAQPTPITRQWIAGGFAGPDGSWPNNASRTAWSGGGEYHVLAREPGRFVAISAPVDAPLRDVRVQARFRKVSGPSGGGYGIIVRDAGPARLDGINQNGRFYVLEAGDRGEFGIWRRDGDRWIDLIPWTPTPAVRPGNAINDLSVLAVGERLEFTINGALVADISDGTLVEGKVGVFVGGDLNEAVVERFTFEEARPLRTPN
jgi:hypothetical protein